MKIAGTQVARVARALSLPLLVGALVGATPLRSDAGIPVATVIPRVAGSAAGVLGTGYDTQARAFRAQCVTGDLVYEGSATSTLTLDHSIQASEVFDRYGFSLAAGLDLGVASAMIGQRIALMTADNQLTHAYSYSHDILGRTATLVNLRLTDEGRRALVKNDPQFARAVCGDEFVQRVDLGALLLLSARLEFRDFTTRTDIEEFLELSFLTFSTTASFSHHTQDFKEATTITVEGVQFGGDPSKLEEVLTQVRTRTCKLSTADQCADIMARLVSYASEPEGLQAQMKNLEYDGANSPTRSYRTGRYEAADAQEVAALATPPVVTAEARGAIAGLADRTRVLVQLQARAETLAAGHLRPAQRVDLAAFSKDARADLNVIADAVDACYVDPPTCAANSARAMEALHTLSPERLVVPVTTYGVCLRAGSSASADTAGLSTIRALAKAVAMTATTWDEAACGSLETKLDTAGSLAIDGNGLSDISALRGILNLRSLQLRENAIGNIGALAELSDLETLDMTNNQVGSLFPIYQLKHLRELRAGYNHIKTLVGVESGTWPSLTLVELHANQIDSFAPLEGRSKLTIVRSVGDRCEVERRRAVELRLVDAALAADFAVLEMGPRWRRPRDPSSGIQAWELCDSVVGSY